jgi:hypothetical protein
MDVTVAYHTGWHGRQYKSTVPRLRGIVHCASVMVVVRAASSVDGVKLVTSDIQLQCLEARRKLRASITSDS